MIELETTEQVSGKLVGRTIMSIEIEKDYALHLEFTDGTSISVMAEHYDRLAIYLG